MVATAPLLLADCGKVPGAGGLPGSCPADIADASAVMSANFGLEGELEGKVKAALAAGIGGWGYARRVILGLVLVLAAAWSGAALSLA